MTTASSIPTRIEQLTPEWLTASLRASEVLHGARVVSVEHEVLGDGEGFMGHVYRLRLRYDAAEAGAPETVVAKLPTTALANRAIGELMGAYEREILFYREFAPKLPLRTPLLYFADLEGGSTSERDAEGAAMLDKWPIWAIQLMMRLVTWIARRRSRRYVVLIEDFGDGACGNQVAGCAPEVASEILAGIAKVHAQYWQDPKLAETVWLRRSDLNPRTLHAVFLKNVAGFTRNFRANAPASFDARIAWLHENAVELLRRLYTVPPETLLHCDMRLDNVILPGKNAADSAIVFFDWQLAGRGPGAYDAAYLLSGALAADVPKDVELEVVRSYHDALVASGISDYSLEACTADYHRGMLAVLHRVASTDLMSMGDGRGVELVALWLERTLARLEGVDLDALLKD